LSSAHPGILHIAPGDSAGGSLRQAIRDVGRDDEVLAFRDDLSCGPICPDSPSVRAAWWSQFYDEMDVYLAGNTFWERVAASEDRLVVWFGRRSAHELAFFLAWTDRLGERPYWIIDVTGRPLPLKGRDGEVSQCDRYEAASVVPPYALATLVGAEQPIEPGFRDRCRRDWKRLQAENAPFRIATEEGLISAPADHFDASLLKWASPEWQSIRRIVGSAMGYDDSPYIQVGDMMLLVRIVALVERGALVAEGDPWDMSSKVRLA
jgi:hypothetical protein